MEGPEPTWYEDWTKDKGGLNVLGFSWILTRPEAVQKLLVKFPPACVVRVKETGEFGVVLSLIGGDSEFPTLKVAPEPGYKTGVEYRPDDLEVVGYWNGLTSQVVESIIDAGKVQQIIARDGKKVQRNDPCPCESGLKWKKCCGKIQESPSPDLSERN